MTSPAVKLVSTLALSREDWLDWRRQGIGGSEVSAIFGLNKYTSAMAVYLDKIGELPPKEDNPQMKAGRMLEDTIAKWFAEESGLKIVRKNAMLQHRDYPFMLANIDRWVKGKNEGVEIKNTSEFNRQDWSGNSAPTEYLLQCNHYMAITGAERWHLVVLIGGWDLQHRVIERDEEIIQMLIRKETEFWYENVLAKVPPAVTGLDGDIMSRMYPESTPTKVIDLPEGEVILQYCEAKRAYKEVEYRLEEAKNKIKFQMQDAEIATYGGEPVFSWKTNKKGSRIFKFLGEE